MKTLLGSVDSPPRARRGSPRSRLRARPGGELRLARAVLVEVERIAVAGKPCEQIDLLVGNEHRAPRRVADLDLAHAAD
jgi:hypothetical protein